MYIKLFKLLKASYCINLNVQNVVSNSYFQDQFFKRPFSAISDEELSVQQFSNDFSFIKSLEVGGKLCASHKIYFPSKMIVSKLN